MPECFSASTDAEIGRIVPDASRGIEALTMMCPMILYGAGAVREPTMSLRQCIDRVGLRNPCTRHCKELAAVLDEWGTTRQEVERVWGKSNPEWVAWADKLKISERLG